MFTTASHRVAATAFLLLALLSGPAVAAAQTEPAECAASARAVEAGRLGQADLDELKYHCPVSAPAALAKAWTGGVVTTPAEFALLAQRSVADAQVYHAVLDVAGNSGRSTAARLAALQSLIAMYDPQRLADPQWLATAHVGDPIPIITHAARASSAPATHVTDVPELLARLSWDDGDAVVRHAATVLRQSLAWSDPRHTPVRAGAVSLVAGCRGLVTLLSTENITLDLQTWASWRGAYIQGSDKGIRKPDAEQDSTSPASRSGVRDLRRKRARAADRSTVNALSAEVILCLLLRGHSLQRSRRYVESRMSSARS